MSAQNQFTASFLERRTGQASDRPAEVGVGSTQDKPNVLVIFGDDIGIPQISAYTRGLMGYQTPNIEPNHK